MKDLIGKKVHCKRNNTTGEVVAQDSVIITVETGGREKQVTMSTFNRWYTVVEDSSEPANPSASVESTTKDEEKKPKERSRKSKSSKSDDIRAPEKTEKKEKSKASDESTGRELRDKFIALVKEVAEGKNLDISVNEKNRTDIVKYNGRNVFECSYAKKRFNVLAHPNSLTPDNTKRVTTLFPKEWGWSLRAKFVFTEITQWPLMKTVITDGLFYRESSPQ